MNHPLILQDHGAIKRLLDDLKVPTAVERLWCVLSGDWSFDGCRIGFDGTAEEFREIRERIERSVDSEGDMFVIWTPRDKRQRGRIPKSLRCGFTVFLDGDKLIALQSVAFVPRPGAIDLLASTPTGQFLAVPGYHVAAWDGTPVDEPAATVLS
ncbi:MAG TPA: hypothetical protein VL426_00340 [Candidatus Binatia bacterium]|jgi:hypothetical protein|nr:hypothetical protein [Candidatus Binatia bacterium]